VLGDKYVMDDEDVCTVRFVLNSEHADDSAHAITAAISHLREYIQTRSP
jgi:hypothetical protein